jgi:hypothetical protein
MPLPRRRPRLARRIAFFAAVISLYALASAVGPVLFSGGGAVTASLDDVLLGAATEPTPVGGVRALLAEDDADENLTAEEKEEKARTKYLFKDTWTLKEVREGMIIFCESV